MKLLIGIGCLLLSSMITMLAHIAYERTVYGDRVCNAWRAEHDNWTAEFFWPVGLELTESANQTIKTGGFLPRSDEVLCKAVEQHASN